LYREFAERDFTIIAVALDAGGPDDVREFIRPAMPIDVPPRMRAIMGWSDADYERAAPPTYPCLIDEEHIVAERYAMPNVPMAVWIDEAGRIVRSAEPAGATDGFRRLDAGTMSLPDAVAQTGRTERARYVAAIRDWIENGSASRYALSGAAAERAATFSDTDALAAASFRLGRFLRERGDGQRAKRWFDEAQRLAPDSWAYFRQALHLDEKGKASGPEFRARVAALGERRYYPEIRYAAAIE
jgi:tetratricopeptide (TPR) repeat protein